MENIFFTTGDKAGKVEGMRERRKRQKVSAEGERGRARCGAEKGMDGAAWRAAYERRSVAFRKIGADCRQRTTCCGIGDLKT